MKRELKWIGIVVAWLVLLGIVGPALISCDDTFGVVLGIALNSCALYATYRLIKKEFHREDA